MDEKLCRIISELEDYTGLKILTVYKQFGKFELNFQTPKNNYVIHTLNVANDEWGWHVYKQCFDLTAKNLFDKIAAELE